MVVCITNAPSISTVYTFTCIFEWTEELSKSGAVGESGQEPEREEAVRVAADKYEGEPTTSSDTGKL